MSSDFDQSSSSGMDSPRRNRQRDQRIPNRDHQERNYDNRHDKDRDRNYDRQRNYDRDRSRSRDKKYNNKRPQYYDRNNNKSGSGGPRRIKRPELDSHLVSFKKFVDFQTQKIGNQKVQKQYDNYKREWQQTQNMKFLKQHKKDAWFKQKYDPLYNERLAQQRKDAVKSLSLQFFKNLELGYYQNINLTVEQAPTSLGFISNHQRQRDNQQSTIVPINSQSLDINLNHTTDITKEPYFGFDPDHNTIFLSLVPITVSKNDILEVVRKLPGYKSIYLSQPVKKRDFARYCWITFQDQSTFKKACDQMNALTIKGQPINVSSSNSKNRKIKILKKYPTSRIETDSKTALKLIKVLDEQNNINGNPLFSMEFLTSRKCFDLCLLYLRRVHAYDYFSGTQFQCQRALVLKMGLSFLRIQANYEQLPDFSTVYKKVQQVAENRMNKKPQKKADFSNIIKQQIQNMILQKQQITRQDIISQSQRIWKCFFKDCQKKFKSCQFLAKHIMGKHSEQSNKKIEGKMQEALEDLMQKAYINDPNKITDYPLLKDERDRQFRGNNRGRNQGGYYRKDRRKQFRDLDQPEGQKTEKIIAKPLINFLDI